MKKRQVGFMVIGYLFFILLSFGLSWAQNPPVLLVVVRASDDTLWKMTCDEMSCSAFSSFPGLFRYQPTVTWDEEVQVWVVVGTASDNSIWLATFDKNGNFNNDWQPIPGLTPSPAGASGSFYGVLGKLSCTSGQVAKWNGSAWECANDESGGGGDITGVTAGTGLTGGGLSGDVTLNVGAGTGISAGADDISVALSYRLPQACTSGQIASWNGSAWVCAADQFNLGDITAVLAGTGLIGGASSGDATLSVGVPYRLPQACTSGQIASWNGSAWVCAEDANSGGDITSVTAGTGLTGGGVSGDVTLNVEVPLSLSGSVSGDGVISGTNSNDSGRGVTGSATSTSDLFNYGGFFTAAGTSGRGVYGHATAIGAISNFGGVFIADGDLGRGVHGQASATGAVTNYGGYFHANGNSGRGVHGETSGLNGIGVEGHALSDGDVVNYGGYFLANGNYGYGVYGNSAGDSGYGVYGRAAGASGHAVYGNAHAVGDVTNYGGFFTAAGDSGIAAYGYATASGDVTNYGGIFKGAGNSGYGVKGDGGLYDFYAAGPGVDYGTASSIRWKRNIQEIDGALDKIMTLRGVYFDWDEEHGGKHDMGFIAEEAGEVIPEIVAYEPDGEYATGIDYGAITPMLVQAIKEQQQQIEELKGQIDKLKKRLEGREGFVAGLNSMSN